MKTFILNLIAPLIARIKGLFVADVSKLIGQIAKLEAKIEAAIEKDTLVLRNMTASLRALTDAVNTKNLDIDAAYKLLNAVSGLTK